MRPLKLVMSAFGPYAKEEIIDFELLDGKNIFLITGPTGAGKTTIFDAISYALFGEASGSTRENDSLRSDFAAKDRLTYVELDFEIRGEKYHLRRVPQQLKPKVKGEGFTTQGAEAELILPDDSVRTGASNVSNKINELLGINKEQFKQIVMLPQGEFKKLLLADSKEREGIFRKIFGTYTYEKIQALLFDKARVLYKDLEKAKERVLTNAKNIKSDDPITIGEYIDFNNIINLLENLIKKSSDKGKSIEVDLKKVREDIEKLQMDRVKGENNNNLIEEEKKVIEKLKVLLDKKDEVDSKEELLSKANKAKEIIYIEDTVALQKKNNKVKVKDRDDVNSNIIKIKNDLKEAEFALKIEEGKEGEKEKLLESASLLKEKEPKLKELENKIQSIKNLKEKLEKNIKLSKIEENDIKSLKEEKLEKEKRSKEISELEKKKIVLEKDIEEKSKLINIARDLYTSIKRYEDDEKSYMDLKDGFEIIENKYKSSKVEYETKEEIYMKEQAGILATELQIGTPCPVCGSLEHPNPAKRVKGVPTELELKESKKRFEKAQEEYNKGILSLTKVKQANEALLSDVINIKLREIDEYIKCGTEYRKDSLGLVKEAGIKLKIQLDELALIFKKLEKEVLEKSSIDKRIEEIDNLLKEKEVYFTQLNSEYTNIFGALKGEEETLKALEREVPEDMRSLVDLKNRVRIIEDKINQYNRALKESQEKVNNYRHRLASEEAKIKEITKIIIEIEEDIDNKERQIENKIKEAGFSGYEEYEGAKKAVESIENFTKEINSYKEELKSLSDRKVELKDKTKDIKFVELEKIDEEILLNKSKEEEVSKLAKEIYSVVSNNSNILKEIKNIQREFEVKEQEYRVIGELSTLANGRKSPYISFERFVLASYFQEIIDSANLRLSKMTGERFILKRKEDKGKGTAQQGLELEVYDNYTGKSRHVKTLSGGESFKASLALALGLSDVVQANAGGISLDTMFIDEGFGTLDPESLENAINALLDLQKGGRLVGIISHVPELKERVDMQLEIKASSEGSSTKFNIV
ncbi:AAA family ATPase [Clostridium sp. LP20]|uniref:AAA family ATPase n=1 Tax=Clostridium sp. LP20 TaxID=3418665 RepID=UPI003EE4D204